MEHLRKLVKRCTVGEYSFDVAINRQIVLDGFKEYPTLWKMMNDTSKNSGGNIDTDDISVLGELMNANDAMEDEVEKFIVFILPKMIEEAGEQVDCDAFLEYCRENDVDDEFVRAMFDFAMLGFTGGRSEKKPKVKMSLK